MIVSIPLTSIGRGAPDADLLRHLAQSDRKVLESFVAAAIDALDSVDGDPDFEDDDPCGQADEDEFNTVVSNHVAIFGRGIVGPGCIISDDDMDRYA